MTTFLDYIYALRGAFEIAGSLVTPFLRSRRTSWGTTVTELHRPLPGDELVPAFKWEYTNAITIQAKASEVWPWLAQMGQGRGGFYSYEVLEDIVGCKIYNAGQILAQFQDIKVGDGIKLHPAAPALPVAQVIPGEAIVLWGQEDVSGAKSEENDPSKFLSLVWSFFVEDQPDGTCRLYARWRSDYGEGMKAMYGPTFIEPVSTAMQREMLRGIKRRVEAAKR